MIAAPRVLFLTRRFWPLANDNTWRMLSLASALENAGWQPHILTAQWHSAWPEQVALRELCVTRIGPSPTTPFRSRRYTRSACDWVARHSSSFDCLVIDAVEEDSVALTARQSNDFPPVIVRFDTIESGGALIERLHTRVVTACRQAAHVIVPHEHARRELVAAGIRIETISVVADGPYHRQPGDAITRSAARRALSEINHELYLRSDDLLWICPCELNRHAGLELLVCAAGPLLETRRNIRCWILGDGPERSRLYELLRHEGWKNDILMPGTFEDLELILAAADVCILPGASQGLSWILPTAVIQGVPTLVCESPAARARLGSAGQALLFEQGNTQHLRAKLESWLERPKAWQATTAQAANHFLDSPSTLDQWRILVGRLERSRRAEST